MRRTVLGVVALSLALVACGAEPKADPSPSPSSPATSPVSTTPPAPVMPEEAEADTKAGAIAFVKYYVELINRAQSNGSVDDLARTEDPACKSCASGRRYISKVYQAGGHIEGGDLKIDVVHSLPNGSINGWTIDARLTFGPQTVVRPSENPSTQHLDGGQTPVTFLVSRSSSGWIVHEWTRAS
jgi:hypothetical protein